MNRQSDVFTFWKKMLNACKWVGYIFKMCVWVDVERSTTQDVQCIREETVDVHPITFFFYFQYKKLIASLAFHCCETTFASTAFQCCETALKSHTGESRLCWFLKMKIITACKSTCLFTTIYMYIYLYHSMLKVKPIPCWGHLPILGWFLEC